jgi:hypothetical protein
MFALSLRHAALVQKKVSSVLTLAEEREMRDLQAEIDGVGERYPESTERLLQAAERKATDYHPSE